MMGLLGLALSIIPPVEFDYFKANGRSMNSVGLWVGELYPAVRLSGMVQPVPRDLYQQNGLDFQKNYFVFFVEKSIEDIRRDVSGDEFYYSGMQFQALSKTNWFHYDGWDEILCVEIPKP